ncbi:MAG: hypothetical protein QOK37_891 [Thermoanaerobaculia bacterium]|nr:hypothetical protein [Thermoanaerobaculia bacterium]
MKTVAQVTSNGPSASDASDATQIELVRSGNAPSHVSRHWLIGSRYATLNMDESDALSWTAAHEFGHLLGLEDRYSESLWSRISSSFGGKRSGTTADPGYEHNIMAVVGGDLESSNVQALIAKNTPHHCLRGHFEAP